MYPSVEQTVKNYLKASAKLRKEIGNDAKKARDFLIAAGITQDRSSVVERFTDNEEVGSSNLPGPIMKKYLTHVVTHVVVAAVVTYVANYIIDKIEEKIEGD